MVDLIWFVVYNDKVMKKRTKPFKVIQIKLPSRMLELLDEAAAKDAEFGGRPSRGRAAAQLLAAGLEAPASPGGY